ncbi:MAG: hypothetical protein M0R06_08920 [Sphaerochaeta sp.]|jgi:hypothetical protein|nr:hypothetical protein [Sphaerochaeta sp.]
MNTITLNVTNLRPECIKMLQDLACRDATFIAAYLSPEGIRLGAALPVVNQQRIDALTELSGAFVRWLERAAEEALAEKAREAEIMDAVGALFGFPPPPPKKAEYLAGVSVIDPVTTINEVPPPAETPVVAEFKLTGKVREPQAQPAKVEAACKKGRKGGKRR